ncbi:hypothetical protein Sste5346_000396 [Sporothrix stenoceras]|uniref:DEAD/DEAH box helicase n=1 Tax=Sporothrix stenoceras TaxID=5173 RepID=A0ABR3ZS62_9PEZI
MEQAAHSLAKWRHAAQPRRQDVLGDFAGRELCVIHGESMLMHCLADARVDFDEGFQLLHLVHAVETFLSKLQSRRCNFNILWFDDHEDLLLPERKTSQEDSSTGQEQARHVAFRKRRLARMVLIRHLQHHSKQATTATNLCFRFTSMESEEFDLYKKKRPIRLFFVSDGQASASQGTVGVMTFESIIFRLTSAGHTVGLVDDIEFKSSEVRATLFLATPGIQFDPAFWKSTGQLRAFTDAERIRKRRLLYENATQDLDSMSLSFRDRTVVLAVSMVLKHDETGDMQKRAAALLVHLAILKHCPLSARPTDATDADSGVTPESALLDGSFMSLFCDAGTALLDPHLGNERCDIGVCDIYDLIDGRIWTSVLKNMPKVVLSGHSLATFKILEALLHKITGIELLPLVSVPDGTSSLTSVSTKPVPCQHVGSLLAFSQPDFEPLLRDVAVNAMVDEDDGQEDEPTSAFKSKPFKDDSHWHSTKKISLRDRLLDYAASLTNAVGKVLEPETIVVSKTPEQNRNSKAPKDNRVVKPEKLKRGKNASKVTEIVRQQEKEARDAERRKAIADWGFTFKRLQRESDILKHYKLLSDHITRLPHASKPVIGPDAHLLACSVLGGQLSKDESNLKAIESDLKARVWKHFHDLQKLPLTGKQSQAAKNLSVTFGFEFDFLPTSQQEDQPFLSEDKIKKLVQGPKHTKAPVLPKYLQKFQLENCGPYMEKGFDSQPDPRVSNFDPDAWQRDVLDTIDKRESLVVVAPTSAGKTFISFYAMKQVLLESDDGVLVYVAPTKALCNQVAADVQARFQKSYPQMMGAKSVWAISTRDNRVNTAVNCQVLVTVPQMLQNLLLSPSSSSGSGGSKAPWTSRIKWIIFDEVHSIGQSDEGVVWEQLLLMAPCPVIALSATVGNPLELKHWLEGCEKDKGRELKMIIHSARYSDLRCYYWTPPASFKLDGFSSPSRWPIPGLGVDGWNQDSPFEFIHPVASLVDRSRDTLYDINFESRDCLSLWESMNKHQSDEYPLDSALDPEVFFDDSAVVKAATVRWETELKKVLLHWLRHHDSPFSKVQKELSSALGQLEQYERYGSERTLQLLVDLQKRDGLPALIFLYDRTGCNESVRQIVAQLGEIEKQWKTASPEWSKKIAAFKKYRKDSEALAKRAAKPAKKRKKGKQSDADGDDGPSSKLDSIREAANQDSSKWDSFDPDAPLESFSLANHTKLSKMELEDYVKKLASVQLADYIIEGLRRGVAVHHAGMNREYLQTVEILFRKGFLTAVVATGTLALGINMPCKTVVFSADSTYLTALNYRQGAGRAGRRGFDILGNVVFYDFAPQRVKEIMSMRLSDLRGHFPISTSLVLRVSSLLHQTGRCEYSRQSLKSLFSQTRMYLGGPEGKEAIKHHLRFSIEYLRRHNLLSAKGAPINFCGLVSHLHYTENAIFAFHSLLESGYLHSLCADIQKDEPNVLDNLMLVLAHLFNRIPCRRYNDQAWLEGIVRPSSSVVLLPPLPSEAETILRKHNTGTLSIFRTYVQTYVRQHLSSRPDDTLPFTHQKVAPTGPLDCRSSFHPGLGDDDQPLPVELRSPFAALSGFNDEFSSIRELCSTVRSGVFLEESSVPYIAIHPTDTDGMPLNAYIYDFFRHGDLKMLVKANGVKDGEVWFLLHDFELTLKTIIASLANFINPCSSVMDDLTVEGLSLSDDEDMEAGGDEDESNEDVMASGYVKTAPKKAKKAKVVESWEDSNSEKEEEEAVNRSASSQALSGALSTSNHILSTASPEQGLKMVIVAFQKLQAQFHEKFVKIYA